jgi:hypothetical protein
LDGIPFFVDNEAEAPVLIKESQPMASCVLVDSTLAENRDLSFAHLTLNERRLDIEPSSDDSCIDAEGALLKLYHSHGLRFRLPLSPQFLRGIWVLRKEVERLPCTPDSCRSITGGNVIEQGQTTCCYAKSEKSWIDDPAGIAWETFLTTGESTNYGDGSGEREARIAHTKSCCGF